MKTRAFLLAILALPLLAADEPPRDLDKIEEWDTVRRLFSLFHIFS